ncbi:unnamed protein product [Vitrella brassicaformis CCMP3155]|uniref:Uncharacterized protein n=1 Tax=Vitrella brassicaformis (strain CCMP3155) TaxID=1169540 RepID=A0A0G4F349_VITBC|nr:unnamed protein product [Vitrella brassicaformis CCMP3155]|eukprot:CEM06469.1 unnamed protein product [Vitrella brassicaformis CCMP3155]
MASRRSRTAGGADEDEDDGADEGNFTNRGLKEQRRRVNEILRRCGVEDPKEVNMCLKAAIAQRFLEPDFSKEDPLSVIVLKTRCEDCNKRISVTMRDLLDQGNVGWDYEDGSEGGGVVCPREDCHWRAYVTRLCLGNPEVDCGKFHHHCSQCPGYGQCIGDYRNAHCEHCGNHYFTGLSGFPCPCGGDEDDDDYDDDDDDEEMGGGGGGRSRGERFNPRDCPLQ